MTNSVYKYYVGIDVSKAKLDIAISKQESNLVFGNKEEDFKELIKALPAKKRTLIILEATGGYEKLVANYLRKKKFAVSVVNAKRVRDFAKASGKLAKTDKIDARTIMLFGQAFNPFPQALVCESQEERGQLIIRREQLVRMIALEKQHLEHVVEGNSKFINQHIGYMEKQLALIEKQLEESFDKDARLKEKRDRLDEIKGVGKVTAMNILIYLPELGTLSSKEASALAGVAPYNKDSGQSQGKKQIAGGRAKVRAALYMAILSARKFNPAIKNFYDRLISRGKLKKVAMVACMRKLITVMNAMLRDNTSWRFHGV